jgi:hypothetical protein
MTEPFNMGTKDPANERERERLRQERETFDQHKAHENRWFALRLVMGYASVLLLLSVMVISGLILLNNAQFPIQVVVAAGAALFTDVVGLLVSVWKVVLNPRFMTRLAPETSLEPAAAQIGETKTPRGAEGTKRDLIILSARYGAQGKVRDVTDLVRSRVSGGKLALPVTNENLGGDPIQGVVKQLDVVYSYSGQTHSVTVEEKQELSLP